MADPVLVEVTRGGKVESRHRGAVAVCDAEGKLVVALGDTGQPVFPRSAVKSIQALALVESGAADALGFGDPELALVCASHAGEPRHVELAEKMLATVGLDNAALECGTHWPTNEDAMIALARSGRRPLALHNNCSGKHSGFICLCCQSGIEPRGYVNARHWLQETVRGAMEDVTGARHDEENRGIDGCSIPTYAIPLKNLAHGFAKMASGLGLGEQRAKAATRLMQACMAEPFLVAGTDKADTRLMRAAPGRIFVKSGAEGVHCAALPELGLGIALKCDDGAGRASEVAIAAMMARLFAQDDGLASELAKLSRPVLTNRNGIEVGNVQPTGVL